MPEQVMVIVADPDDPKHGEINVVENAQKGARLVETLLEAGFDQARIRVFSGAEMDMQVRHRPVVALVSGDANEGAAPSGDEAANRDNGNNVDSSKKTVASATQSESRKEEVAAEHYERNGVRFSTAFRPA
ncbi:MAG: hypothetical protein E6I38_02490 [Chloroflexi bacterium]|nr:MAG: hypothetical protein E6I38_02490 [Chloroflexota bacterium]